MEYEYWPPTRCPFDTWVESGKCRSMSCQRTPPPPPPSRSPFAPSLPTLQKVLNLPAHLERTSYCLGDDAVDAWSGSAACHPGKHPSSLSRLTPSGWSVEWKSRSRHRTWTWAGKTSRCFVSYCCCWHSRCVECGHFVGLTWRTLARILTGIGCCEWTRPRPLRLTRGQQQLQGW